MSFELCVVRCLASYLLCKIISLGDFFVISIVTRFRIYIGTVPIFSRLGFLSLQVVGLCQRGGRGIQSSHPCQVKPSIIFFKFLPLHTHGNWKIVGKNCQNTVHNNAIISVVERHRFDTSGSGSNFPFWNFWCRSGSWFFTHAGKSENFYIHSQQCQLY